MFRLLQLTALTQAAVWMGPSDAGCRKGGNPNNLTMSKGRGMGRSLELSNRWNVDPGGRHAMWKHGWTSIAPGPRALRRDSRWGLSSGSVT